MFLEAPSLTAKFDNSTSGYSANGLDHPDFAALILPLQTGAGSLF